MELKLGYKHTEVRVIPARMWAFQTLQALAGNSETLIGIKPRRD